MNLIKASLSFVILFLFCTSNLLAQDEPVYITVTTIHWNYDKDDGTQEDWLAIEKEYHEKVIEKNELILSSEILNHYFTGDNSEVKVVKVYPSWDAIHKSAKRNEELAIEAWPDEAERKAFFKKQSAYYSTMHSDEIYVSLPNGKQFAGEMKEPMVFFAQIKHLAFPEDGEWEEYASVEKEYAEKVTHKNKYIKAYYPHRHLWGSDGREVIDVFLLNSFEDITASLQENVNLAKAAWPDEEERKAFMKKRNKYFTPWHGDFIYRNVPELRKAGSPPPAVTNTVKNK